jgi:hypothetical protein
MTAFLSAKRYWVLSGALDDSRRLDRNAMKLLRMRVNRSAH